MALKFLSLGRRDYRETLDRQFELRAQRQAGSIVDTILTVEHPPVITEGRREAGGDFRVLPGVLRARGIAVEKVNRGGRLTYHGPGQLVAYYIISLKERGLKIPQLVRAVEETVLKTLEAFEVCGRRREGFPGVWVGERKIASVGMAVDKGVSMHGMALNVNPDLDHFDFIIPCGIPQCPLTSLSRELSRSVSWPETEASFRLAASSVFG